MLLKVISINSDQGLPNEQVHAIRQDKLGRLWLAGPVGLTCYNGSSMRVYDTRNGLECNGLRTICIPSEANIIWIGTDKGIEAIQTVGPKKKRTLDFEWKYGIADSILVEKDKLWVGTSYGLLQLQETEGVLRLLFSAEMGLVSDILRKDEHSLMLVTGKFGLVEFRDNKWKRFSDHLPGGDAVLCIKKTIDPYFLVGTIEGLYILSDHGGLVEHFVLHDQNKKLTSISTLGDEWWLGFGRTLVLASPSNLKLNIKERLNIGSDIKDLFIDHFGNVWVATNNQGIKKISCLREALLPIDCGVEGSVFSIKVDPHRDRFLIAGDRFSTLMQQRPITQGVRVQLMQAFPSIVWDACFDPVDKNIVWYATQNGLFRSTYGETAQRFEEEPQLINSPNRVLLAREDEIWLGTISGLFRIKDNKVEELTNLYGAKFGYVYSLNLNEKDQIWIATLGQGLWLATEEGIIPIENELLSRSANTYAVVSNSFGNTVVIQDQHIILLDAQLNARLITDEFPLGGWSAYWLDQHRVAIGSNDGLILLNTNSRSIVQRVNLHLSKAEWQFTCSRSLIIDSEGRLFCGLNQGLLVVDLKKLERYCLPPLLRLDEIDWNNVIPVLNENVYEVPPGKWAVNISVYTAWFIDEKQVRYRFKLIGFDEQWSDFSSLPTTKYSSLPPGQYELIAQAVTPLTGMGEPVSLMRLEVFQPRWANRLNPLYDKLHAGFDRLFSARLRNKLLIEKNLDLEKEIKDRKKIERELNNYKQRLEEMVVHRTQDLYREKEKVEAADKMKTVFMANMSHEIRTPISGIIGLIDLLEKTNLDPDQINFISKINYSANHLLEIINDILDISKIESGKMEIEQIQFSFEKEVLAEIEMFRGIKMLEKNIDFIIQTDIKNHSPLIGDPLKIKQVLINLLSNAFKFTEEGSIRLEIKQVKAIDDKIGLKFTISDTGIGLTKDQLTTVFQLFQQADTSISRKYGGTGLGLSISHRFVEMMGGELKVRSVPQKGSAFFFTLLFDISKPGSFIPKATLKPSDIADIKLLTPLKPSFAGKPTPHDVYPTGFDKIKHAKILIAEDDEINQLFMSRMLRTEGFDIKMTTNGQECIEALIKDPGFDLILMDVQMPEMDGLAATKYIREKLNNEAVSIIGLTAEALSGTKEKVIRSGMNDYLAKPVKRGELFGKFVQWIRVKKE